MNWIAVTDWLSALILLASAFLVALPQAVRRFGRKASSALAAALLCLAVASFSNAIERSGITNYFEPVEDVVEVLFLPFFLLFAYTLRVDRMLAQLGERAERLRVTLESIGDGILVADESGRITQVNRIMEDLLGRDRDELRGMPARAALLFHDRRGGEPVDLDPVGQVIASGRTVSMQEPFLLRRPGERDILVADSAAPILDDQERVLGVVVVLRDITQQEALAEQLRQTQKMDAIGQLAGGIAHDFNNMLGGILGAAEILAMDLEEESENRELVQLIIDTTGRAGDLTRKLLAFGRKHSVVSTTIDLHEVTGNAVALLDRTLDKRIQLVRELSARSPLIVGDPVQIENAILNLAINARDAMPDGGTLTITTRDVDLDEDWCDASPFTLEPGPHVLVSVEDTGAGMERSVQERIFEPFYTTKEEGRGTGLGLAAVYGTVVSHRGACTLYSEVGIGTAFHLFFPVAEGKARPVEERREPSRRGSGCVLVIDDEDVIRTTAEMILSQAGYEVLTAEDGEAGLEVYRDNAGRIRAVILDMVMPKMNGSETYAALRRIDPEVRVILSSGFTRGQRLDEGLAGFVNKPYRRQELLLALEQVLA